MNEIEPSSPCPPKEPIAPGLSSPPIAQGQSTGLELSRRSLIGRVAAAGPLAWIISACGGGSSGDPATTSAPTTSVSSGVEPAADTTSAATLVEPTDELAARAPTLAPTPACADDGDPTPPQSEGPFYTPDTPERTSLLEPSIAGTTLVVSGRVLDTDCRPVAGALLDFWHCDDAGVYDNVGYRLRGHQFADNNGNWRLETILPGAYTGRTRHIHVRVQRPGGAILTTQLYFPGEPGNASDGIYQPELELTMSPDRPDGGRNGSFDFVLVATS